MPKAETPPDPSPPDPGTGDDSGGDSGDSSDGGSDKQRQEIRAMIREEAHGALKDFFGEDVKPQKAPKGVSRGKGFLQVFLGEDVG